MSGFAGKCAGAVLAERIGVGGAAYHRTSAAVIRVAPQVEAVVDDAIAVVVRAVAQLNATVGHHALATVGGVLVGVDVAGRARGDHARACNAGGSRGRSGTDDAAGTAIERIGLQIESVVDHTIAVVIDAVAQLVRSGTTEGPVEADSRARFAL